MEDRLGQLRIEPLDPLDLAAHQVVAERYLALEAAGIGEVDRERIVVVGHRLADVVKQGPGDRDVPIDPREGRRGGAHRLGNRDRVVEQPVPVGLVVVLGGRSLAEPRPDRGARVEEAVEQLAKLRILDRRRAARAGRPRAAPPERSARRRGRTPSNSSGRAGRIASIVIFAPVLRMDSEPAADVDRGARGRRPRTPPRLLPDHRLDGPGAVADDQPQPLAAVSALAKLALADREHGLDDLAVGELAHPDALRIAGRVPAVDGALGERRLLGQCHLFAHRNSQ